MTTPSGNAPFNKKLILGAAFALALVTLFSTARLTGHATGDDGAGCGGPPEAPHGVSGSGALVAPKNLGQLDPPGKSLGGSVQQLPRGGSLTFTSKQDHGHRILGARVSNPSAVKVFDDPVSGTANHAFTLQVSPTAPVGTTVHVTTLGAWGARKDNGWAFSFDIQITQ